MNQTHKYMLTFFSGALLSLGIGLSTISNTVDTAVAQTAHKAPGLPSRVDVNGTAFAIETVPNQIISPYLPSVTAIGHTDCERRHIYIREGVDTRTILIHELDHAMVCYVDKDGGEVNNLRFNSESNSSHEGIYFQAAMWRELLQRNPGLGEYLGEDK